MNILIDNKDIELDYGITVLDYTPIFGIPQERENERVWSDKSGVDKNRNNIRYDAREFVLKCYIKAANLSVAYNSIKTLTNYMYQKGVFVLSVRDSNTRECFLCQRSTTIIDTISIREQNSLYVFKIGLKDVNPNPVIFKADIVGGEVSIDYTKGQIADIYWGNGDDDEVSNSGIYDHSGYAEDGEVDVIIDIDNDEEEVTSLQALFSADEVSGIKNHDVNFTDESTGVVTIWAWNFGDGNTSSLQNPSHTYTQSGTFTVSLQVFNAAGGSDTETKVSYVTVRSPRLLINSTGALLINSTNNLLIK